MNNDKNKCEHDDPSTNKVWSCRDLHVTWCMVCGAIKAHLLGQAGEWERVREPPRSP